MADNQEHGEHQDEHPQDSENSYRNLNQEMASDYGGSLSRSEFTTLNTATTRLHKYDERTGRRYQGFVEDRYGLPNDEPEQSREHLKHRLYTDYILDGNLFISPIGNNPQKIVDLGTGAGCWPLEVAEKYPSAHVIGSDISAIQPSWMLPNIEFKVEDLDDPSQPWTKIYANSDLIFTRSVMQAVRNPDLFVQRAYENLRPGGWLECHEIFIPLTWEDGTPAMDHPLQQIYDMANNNGFAQKFGWHLYYPSTLPDVLRRLGLINVQEKHSPVPIGRWGPDARSREMGLFNQDVIIDWAAAMLVNHDHLGITSDEASRLGKRLVDDLNNPRVHARLDWGVVWAQKPEDAPPLNLS